MYRIAKRPPFSTLRDQLCRERPPLILQPSISQLNIALPDRIRFFYPAASESATLREVDLTVTALGENAHGVCFVVGVCMQAGEEGLRQAATDTDVAFRIDLIEGTVTRAENGERLSVRAWERRVRRRYAQDREIDALPLSTMLIRAGASRAG